MSIVADDQLAEWLVNGTIAGINSKEEEEKLIQASLNKYCPGGERHVTEVYSPPRITSMVERFKLIPGLALDLTTIDPDDQLPWGFDDPAKRQKAKQLVQTRRSLLVTGSPMFSFQPITETQLSKDEQKGS